MKTTLLRSAVAGALLAGLSPLAAQAANFAAPVLLPGTPVLGPAPGTQRSAAFAPGAGSTLLVFEDDRAGDSDLYGVRVDASGAPLDAVPFVITPDPGNQSAPEVAWNGSTWLVVYSNQVDPGSGYFAYDIAAKRVSSSGEVLDAAPITLANDSTGGNFGVASDGSGWAIAFTGYSAGNNGITAKRVSAAGVVLDPLGVNLFAPSYYVLFGVDVRFAGGQYLFSWSDDGLRMLRTTPSLVPLDAAPQSFPGTPSAWSIASAGNEYFVAWSRQTPLFTSEIVGTRIDRNLQPIGAPAIAISGSAPNVNHTDPRVVWDGSQWIVAWLTFGQQRAYAARVAANGSVLDPGGLEVPENDPNVLYEHALGALPSGGALLAWNDIRNAGQYDLFGVPFDASLAFGAERCYAQAAEAQRAPRVTAGPQQYLVTAKAELTTGSRIIAQRVDGLGQALDVEPLTAASAAHPSLFGGGSAWNGSCYLVVWSDSTQGKVYARRLGADGQWIDAVPIFVLLGGGADVAALGPDFLVTSLRAPSYPQFIYSFGARVSGATGAVLDATPLSLGPSYATRARVTTLGGRWLVATESHWTHDSNQTNLMLSFVSPDGTVAPAINAGNLNVQNWGSLDIASSGTSALVVSQSGSNWTNCDVYAKRVLPDGSLGAAFVNLTSNVGMGQSRACVAWTGSSYAVGYESYEHNAWFYDFEPDLALRRVSETGTLLDSASQFLWSSEDWEVALDAASGSGGHAWFAASTYVGAPYAAPRVALRVLRPDGLANSGIGTSGCSGFEQMDATVAPQPGAAGFALTCTRAPANGFGVLLTSSSVDALGSDPFGLGVLVHVGIASPAVYSIVPLFADADGYATRALPIPADPQLVGLSAHFQAGFAWNGPCVPSPLSLSTSDALSVVVQP